MTIEVGMIRIKKERFYFPIVDNVSIEHLVGETPDIAILLGLAFKYDGVNSQFPKMACRMLNIESQWRD